MVEQNKRLLTAEEIENIPVGVQDEHRKPTIGAVWKGDCELFDVIKQAQDAKTAEIVRAEEATNITNCAIDAKRVHPEWTIDDVIDLLKFREETREAIKNQSGDFISLEEVRQSLKQGHKKEKE